LCERCQSVYLDWYPHEETVEEKPNRKKQSHIDVINALVVPPVTDRFKYHFCGNKPTAAMPCLKWALQFITDTLKNVEEFVKKTIQPACYTVNVMYEIGSALVAQAAEKIGGAINNFVPDNDYPTQDALIIHCVNELTGYEKTMRRSPSLRKLKLKSLFDVVFSMDDIHKPDSTLLQLWIKAEWGVASAALKALAKDGVATWQTDPTSEYGAPVIAETVVDLAFSVTDRFSYLPSASDRTEFVLQFQIPLFQQLLHELVDASPRGSSPDALILRCTLARACLYCEDTLWEWVKEVLPDSVHDDNSIITAATNIAKNYSVLLKDILTQVITPVVEPFCATVNQLFRASPLYGTRSSQAAKGALDENSASIMTDVSEQIAFALDNMLPVIQKCSESILQLHAGGSELCQKFVHRICKKINESYIVGLTTNASERTLSPNAVNQISTDVDAIRAALSVYNPSIAKSMAPLAAVITYLRTSEIPPDAPLQSSTIAELKCLHIL